MRDNDFLDKFEGSMQLLISCPSQKLALKLIGSVDLSTLHPGIYNTVKFPIPGPVQAALAGATFDDLRFQFILSRQLATVGKLYLFDNLHVNSATVVTTNASTTPPSGYGGSVDLDVFGGSGTPGSPVTQTFPISPIQISEGFHLKQGTAGGGTSVQLALGLDGTPSFTCIYLPDPWDTGICPAENDNSKENVGETKEFTLNKSLSNRWLLNRPPED